MTDSNSEKKLRDAVRSGTTEAEVSAGAPILPPITDGLGAAIDDLLSDKLKGIATGFPRTDKLTRGLRDLVILAGAPGVGKSTWALQVALNVSRRGGPVVYYSLEMPRLEMQRRALLAASPRAVPWDALKNNDELREETTSQLGRRAKTLYLVDQSTRVEPNTIEKHLETTRARHDKAPLVVVDHARLVYMGEKYRGADELVRQEDLLAFLMGLTQRTGATVLLVHELNKAGMAGLTLQGIKGTVSAVYDAATVIGLVDPEAEEEESDALPEYTGRETASPEPKRVRLVVRKNRYGPANLWIPFRFNGAAFRFDEVQASEKAFLP